jgi:uncharacterized protein with HEPN domain
MRSEELYLRDIVEASDTIATFLDGIDEEEFLSDELLHSAIIYKLTIIGEASSKLSPNLRDANPDIPWKSIIGFRNVVVHAYFSVYWETVWTTARFEVPAIRNRVVQILNSLFPNSDESHNA